MGARSPDHSPIRITRQQYPDQLGQNLWEWSPGIIQDSQVMQMICIWVAAEGKREWSFDEYKVLVKKFDSFLGVCCTTSILYCTFKILLGR